MQHRVEMHKGFANEADGYAGGQLKQLRKHFKVSQKQLAQALGITFQQVQKYENGLNRISVGKLFEIAKYFDVSVVYFFAVPDEELQMISHFRHCLPRRKHVLLELAETYAKEGDMV